jgi:alanine dehydrogenase
MHKKTYVVEDAQKIADSSPYTELVPKIESAFLSYHNGDVEMPDKSYVDINRHNGDFRSMPAYIEAQDWESSGIKWVNVHPDNEDYPTVMGTVILTNPQNGFPLAIMNGTEITGRRTGAVAAVATDYLAEDNAEKLGVVGAGAQSYEQVEAISTVRNLDTILVSDIDNGLEKQFVEHFGKRYDTRSASIDKISQCDIICTVTPSTSPILSDVREGTHINAMGADAPQKQELDRQIVTNKDTRLIVDDISQTIHSGEVSKSYQDGHLSKEDIQTLGSVVSSSKSYSGEATVFDSTGLAIQDIATAHLIYDSVDFDGVNTINLL